MCCGGWVHNARVQQLCSKALRMRSACTQFSAWRVQQQTALYSVLLLANHSIQRNLRMMSVQDQEETDPLIHGGAASLDRAPGCRQDFSSSLNFYRDVHV